MWLRGRQSCIPRTPEATAPTTRCADLRSLSRRQARAVGWHRASAEIGDELLHLADFAHLRLNDAVSELSHARVTEPEQVALLRHYRDRVIAPATAGWQAQRSILRDSMIETLVQQNITDPDAWFSKVPTYLRQGTDPTEKRLHLERICDLVARRTKKS